MRYGAGVLKCNTNELKCLDRRTRKFMTIYGTLYLRTDIDKVKQEMREMRGRIKKF